MAREIPDDERQGKRTLRMKNGRPVDDDEDDEDAEE